MQVPPDLHALSVIPYPLSRYVAAHLDEPVLQPARTRVAAFKSEYIGMGQEEPDCVFIAALHRRLFIKADQSMAIVVFMRFKQRVVQRHGQPAP